MAATVVARVLAFALVGSLLSCSTIASAASQDAKHASVPVVTVVRSVGPVTIDGKLDDEVWQVAQPASEFTQTDPDEGKPATERTEVRVAYDAAALYFAARLHDRDATKIARQLARRTRRPIRSRSTSIRITIT